MLTLLFLFPALSLCAQDSNWVNPTIECLPGAREKAIKSFPYVQPEPKDEDGDVEGMTEFNDRMQEHFSHSELDSTEALVVYEAIAFSRIVRDESYGMPAPGDTIKTLTEAKRLYDRVAVKKTAESEYDILYYKQHCGTSYHFVHIIIEEDGIIYTAKEKERWKASYPC